VIVASHLTRRFGARTAVEDLTFEIQPSQIVALVGPNGAGKTTTLRMLAGLLQPTTGTIVVDGVELTAASARTVSRRIGFLTETPALWDRLTVRENLGVYAGLYSVARPAAAVDRVLDLLGLAARSSSRTAELSKGLRQKVALARALLHEPSILLLDEPTSGLDPEVTRDVRRLFEERRAAGASLVVSTHNLDEAERLADRIAVLQGRLLAFERPATLRQRLSGGRTLLRTSGDAARFLGVARGVDPSAQAEGSVLTLRVADPGRDVPLLVRAMVEAGADILEVRPYTAPLEEAYLQLLAHEHPLATVGPQA
jgi:ABC-2 type transport system ATP-binding protein